MKMNPVIHFEMPSTDSKRMTAFYAKVFGWKTQQLGPEMGSYVVVTTHEDKDNIHSQNNNAINGGFYPKGDDPLTHHGNVVIAVDDIQAHVKAVQAGGGKVLGDPMMIPGIGWYAGFLDTEGNRVGMLQPIVNMPVHG
jgi:uncharacterized protein